MLQFWRHIGDRFGKKSPIFQEFGGEWEEWEKMIEKTAKSLSQVSIMGILQRKRDCQVRLDRMDIYSLNPSNYSIFVLTGAPINGL